MSHISMVLSIMFSANKKRKFKMFIIEIKHQIADCELLLKYFITS